VTRKTVERVLAGIDVKGAITLAVVDRTLTPKL